MKLRLLFLMFLFIFLFSCQQSSKTISQIKEATQLITIDSTLRDTIMRHTEFVSDKSFSHVRTPIEARFYSNGILTDSIIQDDFPMDSWYSSREDTVDLVAHVGGGLETEALLIRFISGKPNVFFFRAPHMRHHYFRVNKTDSFTNQIYVPLIRYKLRLSQVPDSINKSVVFGSIDMESSDYYDKRDSLQQPQRVQLKFYFGSQFREFNY